MFKILLLFVIPFRLMNIQNHHDIIAKMITLGSTIIPILFQKKPPCLSDLDCPNIQKCCLMQNTYFCCPPEHQYYMPYYLETINKNELKAT